MKNKTKNYLPYIKLLYSGLISNFITVNTSKDLFRGALINKEEIQNLINHLNRRKSSDIPCGLIFCKSFMSFSLDKSVALDFMHRKKPTDKTIRVLYTLKGESGLNYKNATNADLSGISYFENEKEILLFPFSVYEISTITKKDNYYEINLGYLEKYKEIFQFKSQTDLYNSIFKSNFIKELELSGLSMPIWLAKKSLCNINFHGIRGSGFCCLIRLPDKKMKIPVLIVSHHLLNKNNLKICDEILLESDNGNELFKIKIGENSKIYSERVYDITIIEIEKNSDISNELIFMDIDEDIFNDKDFLCKLFYKKNAYILQYAKPETTNKYDRKNELIIKKNLEEFTKDKQYSIEEGNIIVEDEIKIIHNIPTYFGAAGAPIISPDKFEVIGYHKGKKIKTDSNYCEFGYLFKWPIEKFIEEFYS
jgi:hypothetical protein